MTVVYETFDSTILAYALTLYIFSSIYRLSSQLLTFQHYPSRWSIYIEYAYLGKELEELNLAKRLCEKIC